MKKHSREEILLKLGQAEKLARAGKSQVEICKALGVSVMTFHRWRKLDIIKAMKGSASSCGRTSTLSAGWRGGNGPCS
jgi:hypothetical protein